MPVQYQQDMSHNTRRLYRRIQEEFNEWCALRQLKHPVTHNAVATYLLECLEVRGASTVTIRLSAIARMYRDQGMVLDSKNETIQTVVRESKRVDKVLTMQKRILGGGNR